MTTEKKTWASPALTTHGNVVDVTKTQVVCAKEGTTADACQGCQGSITHCSCI